MTGRYLPPDLLAPNHDLSAFHCRSSDQTDWLLRHARQASATGTSRVFVVTETGSPVVGAYYAWCMAQVVARAAPERLLKGAGRYPQAVALLARLAVDISHERRGLGAGLLRDVIARVAELSTEIGCRGLLVHAESIEARDFYTHLIPEFEPSPSDDLHLILLTKDIQRTLRG